MNVAFAFAFAALILLGAPAPAQHLVRRFPPATAGELEHWHHDVFRVNWRLRDPPSGWLNPHELVTFALDPAGNVDALRIDGGVGEFKRAPAPDAP